MSHRIFSEKNPRLILYIILAVLVAMVLYMFIMRSKIAVFSARGPVAAKERNITIFALLLSLLIVIPVYFLTFFFAWKYRESNSSAEYKPDWDSDRLAETTWWVIPSILIMILSVITWRSSHDLDPFKPLASAKPATTIQVVALDWKWLFIYPEAKIATVNYVQFPADQPVKFQITADAPITTNVADHGIPVTAATTGTDQ